MAGGIFPGRPFAWNIKCIIFTVILAAGYWWAPSRNLWVLFFLLWAPYVALAWYDYSYDCKDKMQPTLIPYGRSIFLPFKPPGYRAEFEKLPPEQIQAMNTLDHNVTWIILIVLIFAIGIYLRKKKLF
jgi:hypothetical protein